MGAYISINSGGGGGGGVTSASNGLNLSGTDVRLGGTLISNTTISGAFNLTINNVGGYFKVTDYINFDIIAANNTFLGYQAGNSNVTDVVGVTGVRNIYIGNHAGYSNVNGIQNVAIGWESQNENTSDQNTSVGTHSARGNITGNQFVAIGNNAHENGASGSRFIAIGVQAMVDSTADDNVAIGTFAMLANTTGGANVAMGGGGVYAANATGDNSTIIGYSAARFNTSSEHVVVGANAMYNNAGGNNNTVIGRYAGYTGTAYTGCVFLGSRAGFYETGDSKLFIDNATRASEADGRSKALVYGIFDASASNQELYFNAQTINMSYLPTSAAGLSTGDLWNNSGVLNIV